MPKHPHPRHLARALTAAALVVAACSHNNATNPAQPTVAPEQNAGGSPGVAANPQGGTAANTPPPANPPPTNTPPTPAGPSAHVTGDHYALDVGLATVAAVPGDSTLTIALHPDTGYHVNQEFPIAVELTVQNASADKTSLHRADAQTFTEQLASFSLPVHVTAAHATVTGSMRFAVCSPDSCIPRSQQFAVNLP